MPRSFRDLTNMRFGRLTAIQRLRTNARGAGVWLCICDCGTEKEITVDNLTGNHGTKSCGCFKRERMQQMGKKSGKDCPSYKHGGRHTTEYYIWNAMRQRCRNGNDSNFPNYGGRGIKVCKRWNKFEIFLSDMGKRPSALYSLDRINVNGNYCPKNCRWATKSEQMTNRRKYKAIENYSNDELLREIKRRGLS